MPYLTSTVFCLLSVRFFCWFEAILASYRFLGFLLLRERQGCTVIKVRNAATNFTRNPSTKVLISFQFNDNVTPMNCTCDFCFVAKCSNYLDLSNFESCELRVGESIYCCNFSACSGTIKRGYFVLLKLRVSQGVRWTRKFGFTVH